MSALDTRQRRLVLLMALTLALLSALQLPFLPVSAQPALLWLAALYLRVFAPELLRLIPLLLIGLWQDIIWQWPLGASLPPLFVLYIASPQLQQFAGRFILQWLVVGLAVAVAAVAEWASLSLVFDALMPTAPLLGRILATWLCWPFIYWIYNRLLARWRLRAALRRREG